MKFPKDIVVMGRQIDVFILDEPIGVTGEKDDNGEQCYITGQYNPLDDTIKVYNIDDRPTIGGHNFVHEVIEAVNSHGDLQLNHTQISTLASTLYDTFSRASLSFAEAA